MDDRSAKDDRKSAVEDPNKALTQPARRDFLASTAATYSRYFDNPQFWSTPKDPSDPDADRRPRTSC